MSIRTSFNPLGTLGGGGLMPLDYVVVDGTAATTSTDLVYAALGTNYDISAHGSDGYSFFVKCTGFSGRNRAEILGPAGIYSSQWNNTPYGKLVCYIYSPGGTLTFMVRMCSPGGLLTVRSYDYDTEGAWFCARFEAGELDCESDTNVRNVHSVEPWTAEQSGVHRVRLCRAAGMSYKFHGLRVQTTAQSFAALPARQEGKEGIAFVVDDEPVKFLEL